uniref:Uncharacterized protein n=1 Tax=Chromera velia CCMP2878 TaxID=1169474 RepID=A0A0G4GJR7_9ALVE|eukprot:Cvel_22208.t1-p1 / transcript=Cvel_22208.t1 / gene=Cvel_22208 / organism=Chromera_velia_CCMP2878 / gene_product=hypothetical protein / transcript_product=hypothetical protein / location=Cvel_scaffold2158:9896-11094(-) / protein_length=94 / sequence_SO=supercontig / SO=protein_coding / is_pseudo=false
MLSKVPLARGSAASDDNAVVDRSTEFSNNIQHRVSFNLFSWAFWYAHFKPLTEDEEKQIDACCALTFEIQNRRYDGLFRIVKLAESPLPVCVYE